MGYHSLLGLFSQAYRRLRTALPFIRLPFVYWDYRISAFPANNRIVTTWFPRRERAFATGVYTAGVCGSCLCDTSSILDHDDFRLENRLYYGRCARYHICFLFGTSIITNRRASEDK